MDNRINVIHANECKCFSWKPIVAGALMATGLSFLLNLFSVAISLTAYTTNQEGIETLALGGLIATALGIIVSMFASGWVTGYLGGRYCTKHHLGALYGFLAWCLALLIMVLLAEYLAKYVAYYTHFISGTLTSSAVEQAGVAVKHATPENKIVISTYIVFCLFFLSAFACSLGGHCGMRYTDKNTVNP